MRPDLTLLRAPILTGLQPDVMLLTFEMRDCHVLANMSHTEERKIWPT